MNAGMLTLLGSLVGAGPQAPAPSVGIPPTPGMAPPAAVAPPVMMPFHHPGLPCPAPLLAAKVLAPPGVRFTLYPGCRMARMFEEPVVFGLRPGYVYRMELTNLPYQPGRSLYPEVEVHGTLVPRAGMKYMDYPIPLLFTQGDIDRALAGAVITKVIYLEDPEKALPTTIPLDSPVELPDASEQQAIKAAIDNGRLVAIVRLGAKIPPPELLQVMAIDGTILMPGEKYLRAPLLPPVFRWFACPLFDPILGPKPPKEECFVDGGDKGAPLGIGPNERLGGLDPTDVGVEYTIGGRRRVTCSNVVCICSPRFLIRRVEIAPAGFILPVKLIENAVAKGPIIHQELRPVMAEIGREKPTELAGRVRPMAYVGRVAPGFFIGTIRPQVHAQVEGVKVEAAYVEPEVITGPLCPLTVTKEVTPCGPVPIGEVVTITIRYKNTGNRPVSDVVVNDSLSGRLEYVVGSQQTDRAANFTATANDVGSVVLRWEMPGTILPGQGGVVKFRAKVR
jgi:uncharacterized repeat protein (TIGR01451 family)